MRAVLQRICHSVRSDDVRLFQGEMEALGDRTSRDPPWHLKVERHTMPPYLPLMDPTDHETFTGVVGASRAVCVQLVYRPIYICGWRAAQCVHLGGRTAALAHTVVSATTLAATVVDAAIGHGELAESFDRMFKQNTSCMQQLLRTKNQSRTQP